MTSIEPAAPAPTPSPDSSDKMSFFDHLAELRMRLLWSLVAIGVGFGVGFAYAEEAFAFLARPMMRAFEQAGYSQQQMIFTNPLGALRLYISVGLYLGIVLALPFVLYQLWRFVAPGLYRNERRAIGLFLFSSIFLFLAGTAFGYYVLLPVTLTFLISLQGNFTPMISINEYFDVVLVILLGLVVVFQLPILIFFLSLFGIVTPGFLWRNFQYAVLLIALVAALVTPTTDIVTMVVFMVPMLGLYVLGIAVSYLVVRRRRAREAVWTRR